MASELKRTPLYEVHRRLGAKLVPFAGFEMPIQYSGVKAEHAAVRAGVGIFDVSHMGELAVQGKDALTAVNELITNDLLRISDGQALYTCCCNERGTILDDLIVYRLAADDILVVCNASNRDKIVAHLQNNLAGDATLTDNSDSTCLIAVQGPESGSLSSRLVDRPLFEEVRKFRTIAFDSSAYGPLRIARTGYTGEDGVEIFCSNEHAPLLFEDLAGEGAVPAGLAARDTLRLEASLSLYGNDIDETTTPLEAGLGWTVKFDKPSFVGKAALEAQRSSGITKRLVGFEMKGRGIARHDYPIVDKNDQVIGRCTSGSPAPTLGTNIGLGYVPPALAEIGTPLNVDCRGKKVPAVVVSTPFYRRQQPKP